MIGGYKSASIACWRGVNSQQQFPRDVAHSLSSEMLGCAIWMIKSSTLSMTRLMTSKQFLFSIIFVPNDLFAGCCPMLKQTFKFQTNDCQVKRHNRFNLSRWLITQTYTWAIYFYLVNFLSLSIFGETEPGEKIFGGNVWMLVVWFVQFSVQWHKTRMFNFISVEFVTVTRQCWL